MILSKIECDAYVFFLVGLIYQICQVLLAPYWYKKTVTSTVEHQIK
jgi:hypothetical protein